MPVRKQLKVNLKSTQAHSQYSDFLLGTVLSALFMQVATAIAGGSFSSQNVTYLSARHHSNVALNCSTYCLEL